MLAAVWARAFTPLPLFTRFCRSDDTLQHIRSTRLLCPHLRHRGLYLTLPRFISNKVQILLWASASDQIANSVLLAFCKFRRLASLAGLQVYTYTNMLRLIRRVFFLHTMTFSVSREDYVWLCWESSDILSVKKDQISFSLNALDCSIEGIACFSFTQI